MTFFATVPVVVTAAAVFFSLVAYLPCHFFPFSFAPFYSSTNGLDPTATRRHARWIQCYTRMLHRSVSNKFELLVER